MAGRARRADRRSILAEIGDDRARFADARGLTAYARQRAGDPGER
jgi:hypothetical protein